MVVTLYTRGYHGWGNATEAFVRLADRVEAARGFAPPLFVDIRIRRSVRAQGFQGPAFERLLGPTRHVWMRGLGNETILTGGGGMRLSRPADAGRLLDLALADPRRRVLFFCSCPWPAVNGEAVCHRSLVADLLLDEARRRGERVEVIEWPGGEPRDVPLPDLPVPSRGAANLALPGEPGSDLCGLPWGSLLRVGHPGTRLVSGPARCHGGRWQLPIFATMPDDAPDETAEAAARAFRLQHRLNGRSA